MEGLTELGHVLQEINKRHTTGDPSGRSTLPPYHHQDQHPPIPIITTTTTRTITTAMSDGFVAVRKRQISDADAAAAVEITWLIEPHKSAVQQHRKIQTERLCREAVEGGFVRVVIGQNPAKIIIRQVISFLYFIQQY